MNYTYEEINKHIQWLFEFMKKEYPNGFELVIKPTGAEVRSNLCVMSFLSDDLKPKEQKQEDLEDVLEKLKKASGTILNNRTTILNNDE